MIAIQKFTFNPFQENTYVLWDETKQCVIIDPGTYSDDEKEQLIAFIRSKKLVPMHLLNTHCHIDHILGNSIVSETFGLKLEAHILEEPILAGSPIWGQQYGIKGDQSPKIQVPLEEGDVITFGNSELEVLFVPGHSPGHIAFVSHEDKFVINGDVLFQGSYGRYDLPGGDIKVLAKSIREKLFTLPDDYTVYAGHMGETTIGFEKKTNPILHVNY